MAGFVGVMLEWVVRAWVVVGLDIVSVGVLYSKTV